MKKLYSILIALLLLTTIQGQQILRFSNYTIPAVPGAIDSASWETEYKTLYYHWAAGSRPAIDTADIENTMVRSLIDSSLWTNRIDLLYVFATGRNGGGEAFHNWKSPTTFLITDPGTTAPTFTAYNGFDGDGASDYLSTNYDVATDTINVRLNSVTIGAYVMDDNVGAYYVMGTQESNRILGFRPRSVTTGAQRSLMNSSGIMSLAVAASTGMHLVTRRGVAETEGYQTGVSLGSDTDASESNLSNNDIYILAKNNAGTADEFYPGEVAIVIVMNAISDTEARMLNRIFEAYMDAIGTGTQ